MKSDNQDWSHLEPISLGDLSFQHGPIRRELTDIFLEVLDTNNFIGGTHVQEFEEAFASYVGSKHAIGVGNGTDALEIIIQAIGLPKKSKIMVPANSFIATAEAVVNTGHIPVFVDVLDDFSIDPSHYSQIVNVDYSVRAVIAVHLFGHGNKLDFMERDIQSNRIILIEDCAQAHGTLVDGRHAGTRGKAAAFSFFPGKNLGALGDAGAIITDDSELAEMCLRIRNHGRLGKYDHEVIGRNSRLDALQARILSLKLSHLDRWISIRRRNANLYRARLRSINAIKLPPNSEAEFATYHHFVIQVDERDKLQEHLLTRRISTGIHYPTALNLTNSFAWLNSANPNSEKLAERIISLPVAEHVSEAQINLVCDAIESFFSTGEPT